jgi:hypothetical protein
MHFLQPFAGKESWLHLSLNYVEPTIKFIFWQMVAVQNNKILNFAPLAFVP